MKKPLLLLLILSAFGGCENIFSQCNTGWTQIPSGAYASYSTTADSYIAAGDTVNVTGAFTVNSDNFCNDGTLITGTFSKASGIYTLTNSGSILSGGNIICEGTLINCGTIEITGSGTFARASTIYPVTNQASGTILIRGSGLTSTISGNFTNHGRFKTEGHLLRTSSIPTLTNSSTGYFRVCGELSNAGTITNSGIMEVLGQIYMSVTTTVTLTNNPGAVLNVTDDIDIRGNFVNKGCVTVGDSLWKRGITSTTSVTIDSGTVFTTNFIQDKGSLIGGASSAARGYLRVSGFSQTLNTVNLTGYLDLGDAGHPGVAPYFDSESPAYTYPTTNVTDYGSSPTCTQATLISCSDPLPPATGSCATTGIPFVANPQQEITIYPTLSAGDVFIYSKDFPFTVAVFDGLGQKVFAENYPNGERQKIWLGFLPAGIYFIHVISKTESIVKKIIVK